MDTTLRDGEQTDGVSLPGNEKLILAQRLLGKVLVDRIEVASCRVSPGEQVSLKSIMDWARGKGWEDRVEVLGFTDHKLSVDWMTEAGCKRMNLLTKGSLHHLEGQLRKTPAEHRADIEATLDYARKKGVTVSIYLEDWSNGMIHSRDFVFEMLDHYTRWPFHRILLPDTLGILEPAQVHDFLSIVFARYPETEFEFHGHNDYGLATANTLAAAKLGVAGVHCTVNGLGERAGNTPLEEAVAAIRDHSQRKVRVRDAELKGMSEIVELFSGKRIADNSPITGKNVFTQTAGIHADGDRKGNLYESRLSPARFGRDRVYALGKLAGRSNLDFNLDSLNIQLTKEQRAAVLRRVVELGDRKHVVTAEDLPFLIADTLNEPAAHLFKVRNCMVTSAVGLPPAATICVEFKGQTFEATGSGSGGFDAFMMALRSIAPAMELDLPRLIDYEVHIPPGGKTDALVETTITWDGGMKTRAVHSDQVMAAIEAAERMVNLLAQGILGPSASRNGRKPARAKSEGSRAHQPTRQVRASASARAKK
ncbi:2-isopropylmalate synthase [Candidatus Poribacteria bacterium]|nr:2-isopropylmalate synthase [Candidatus Poribacteria bacterium]